jgi:hypothetical protein
VLAAALLGLTALIASTAAAKRPLCKAGRFLVQGEPLISSDSGGPQPVVVGEGRASIDEICPPTRAKLTRSKQGTAITAKWPACTGVDGKVRMKGTLDVACATLSGRLTAKKAELKQEFAALESACGDGAFDPSGGEVCDANLGCPADQHCTEACACAPGAPTTTTTVNTTPTTTTTCTASVTATGPATADYIMFSGMETAQLEEYDETSHCDPVTSPVRSGRYACEIPQGFFSAVRPSRFSEREVFVRVYHRIDVVTNPSQPSFEPVIVTDVLPQGITAVDVGVQSDGTIRYRLRNRFRAINLGQSDPLPPGVWRRIELSTSMGTVHAEGTAELRIDGVPVVSADSLDLSEPGNPVPPLDSVFISHNPNQYEGAFGGVWKAFYDDIAITRNDFPGEGRVIARQGRPGTPSANDWTLVGATTIDDAWSETPASGVKRAESAAAGDPLAQTMLVAPVGQGVDPICNGNVVKACQVWVYAALGASPADRTYATRRRIAGANTDVPLPPECGGGNVSPTCLSNQFGSMQSDALGGSFWSASVDELNGAEIGAVKSGGAGGTPLRIPDAWLSCEYQ